MKNYQSQGKTQQSTMEAIVSGRVKAITAIIDKIRCSQDLSTIFQTTTQELRRLLKSDRLLVYQFNSDWSGRVVAESVGSKWISLLQKSESHAHNGEQYQQENIVKIDDYLQQTQGGRYLYGQKFSVVNDIYGQGFSDCYIETLEKYQAKAYIIVPIFYQEKLWGLLCTYQNDQQRVWQDSETSLMMLVSSQLGIAIQQAGYIKRLRKEAQRKEIQTQQSDAIAHILYKISHIYDIDEIFSIITQELRQVLQSDRFVVYQFNPDWSGQVVAESVGEGWISLLTNQANNELRLEEQVQMDHNVISDWASTYQEEIFGTDSFLQQTKGGRYSFGKKFSVVNDIYEQGFPDCYLEALERNQSRAYIIVPIFQEQKLWGLLGTYQNSGKRIWKETEIDLMMQVANQSAIALKQAKYVEQLKQQTQTAVFNAERSKAIAQILYQIRHTYEIDTIFKIITQEMRQTLKADRCLLYQFNEDWTGQIVAESVGDGWSSLLARQNKTQVSSEQDAQIDADKARAWSAEKDDDIFQVDDCLRKAKGGTYVFGKKFSVVNDIYKAGFPDCYIEALERNQARAYIIIPIFHQEKLWGFLSTYQNDAPRIWQDSEIDLMIEVANQSAIAIKQAEYVAQLKQQTQLAVSAADRSKAVAHILYKIRHAYDINEIFKIITQEMRRALQSDRFVVYQFNPDWSGQVVAESVGSGWTSLLVEQAQDEVLRSNRTDSDRCLLRDWFKLEQEDIFGADSFLQETQGGRYSFGKKFSVVNDIYDQGFPDCYLQALEKTQAKAYIVVPIFQGENLWGLLGTYQNDGQRIWQDSEVELMMQVADQSAIALKQAEYLEELKHQSETIKHAFDELQLTQDQLIKQEKLSALGQLVAGIAHEINTPLGAIRASAGDNTRSLVAAIDELPKLYEHLTSDDQDIFFKLLDCVISSKPLYSSREKRPLKRKIKEQLAEYEIKNARQIADVLIDIGVYTEVDDYLSLLQHSKVDWILDLVYNLSCLMGNNRTIITSVEKAAKVVFALKNYARFDHFGNKQLVSVTDGLETVLAIYHNHLKHSIEVFRHYEDLPEIWCYPDELMQVWTNLIHNGIQSMEDGGQLTVKTSKEDNGIKVEISDSGSGIPKDIQERIFEPFFTTKPTGEGSGLGLHISQKIIDKHKGFIVVNSEPGHTRFSIWLPLATDEH